MSDNESALSPEKAQKCPHPSWSTESDGHTSRRYVCTTCGHWTLLAPWLLAPRAERNGVSD